MWSQVWFTMQFNTLYLGKEPWSSISSKILDNIHSYSIFIFKQQRYLHVAFIVGQNTLPEMYKSSFLYFQQHCCLFATKYSYNTYLPPFYQETIITLIAKFSKLKHVSQSFRKLARLSLSLGAGIKPQMLTHNIPQVYPSERHLSHGNSHVTHS